MTKINFLTESVLKKGRVWGKKYNKIIFTAGISHGEEKKIEEIAKNLLKNKGILICPYNYGPILIYKKDGEIKKSRTSDEYVFVPLLE